MTTKVTTSLAISFYVLGCLLLYKTRGRGASFPRSLSLRSVSTNKKIFRNHENDDCEDYDFKILQRFRIMEIIIKKYKSSESLHFYFCNPIVVQV